MLFCIHEYEASDALPFLRLCTSECLHYLRKAIRLHDIHKALPRHISSSRNSRGELSELLA